MRCLKFLWGFKKYCYLWKSQVFNCLFSYLVFKERKSQEVSPEGATLDTCKSSGTYSMILISSMQGKGPGG